MRETRFEGSRTGSRQRVSLYTCVAACKACDENIPEDGTCHAVPARRGWGYVLYHADCCPLPHPHPRADD